MSRLKAIRVAVRNFLELLVRMRFPGLGLLFFVFWAPLSLVLLPSVLGNVLLLDSYLKLGVFTCSTTLAIMFAISMYRILYTRIKLDADPVAKIRFWPWGGIRMIGLFVFASIVSPLFSYRHSYSQGELVKDHVSAMVCILIAILAAVAVFALLALARTIVFGKTKHDVEFFPFGSSFDRYSSRTTSVSADWRLIFSVGIIALLYFFRLRPTESNNVEQWFSVPSYVVWSVWLSMLVISGLAYWLDKARIPTLLVLVFIVIGIRGYSTSENFETIPVSDDNSWIVDDWQAYKDPNDALVTKQDSDSPTNDDLKESDIDDARLLIEDVAWETIQNRIAQAPRPVLKTKNEDGTTTETKPGKSLIVVTCPGGGIHAAAWTSYVLEQLDARYEGFGDSIGLISGVSGGSVGTMFYSASRYFRGANAVSDPQASNAAWRLSAESSLEDIAAGLAFDDIPAAFIPKFLWYHSRIDRGKRLENAWETKLPVEAQDQLFGNWGAHANNGSMPIIVFNATDAKSGRRILFDSIPTPPRRSYDGKIARPINFRELIKAPGKNDIRVVSAARCSATFPYVSPFVRPDKASTLGAEIAIGDGGYVDNEGILTAIDWIDFVSRRYSEERQLQRQSGADEDKERQFKRIILLQIQPYESIESPPKKPGIADRVAAKFRWLTGPLEALVSMRTTSQLERGQLESDLVRTYIDSPWWLEDAPKKSEQNVPTPNFSQGERKRLYATISPKRSMARNAGASDSGEDDKDEPAAQAFVGKAIDSPIDAPVISLTFPFIPFDESAIVPLNWKLSKNQKEAYPKAWGNLDQPFFLELDQLFKRRASK